MGIDARMYISKPKSFLTDNEIRLLGWRIGGMFSNILWRDYDKKWNALQPTDVMYQDAEENITKKQNEQLIEVHLMCRYYGIGYERGPILDIINLAEYIEQQLPDAYIGYGGDSSGVYTKFNQVFRDALKKHFFKVGGRLPYVAGFNSVSRHDIPICPRCKQPMIANSWGGDMTGYYCYGCSNQAVAWPPNNIRHFDNNSERTSSNFDEIMKERKANNS